MDNLHTIQINAETYKKLNQLATRKRVSLDDLLKQWLNAEFQSDPDSIKEELPGSAVEGEYPLLRLAGIVDIEEETDASEKVSEIVRTFIYEYGLTVKKDDRTD